ncbi:MAG: hypothetical protein QN187_04170 [Armatimonadota bacterium]|nr:hypothetical protein [Armatimonadota bacterium]MDR7520415.1 hypothetical protein [Armatimonadota bacterium]MDR7549147.1 hypothetical protein [Armatimonadota bacterium]
MCTDRWVAGILAGWLMLAPLAAAGAGPTVKVKEPATVVKVKRQGEAYCFDRPFVLSSVAIAGGRCYTFYLVRTSSGGFLGFGPPGPPMIPPGQIVRMGTPAGAKVKGRLFYLIPLPGPAIIMPVDTIRYVTVQVVAQPSTVRIVLPAGTVYPDRELDLPTGPER